MDNQDVRKILITICEILKAEYKYLASLHRGQIATYEALKKELPEIEIRYTAEAEQVFGQEYPGTAENVQQLDALLQQLSRQ